MVFVLLPLACWLCLFLTLWRRGQGVRRSFLLASLGWGILVLLFSELLSVFHAFNRTWLAIVWGLTAITLLVALRFSTASERPEPASEQARLGPTLRAMLGAVAAILLITGMTAVIAPPNNFDSMTYHMARVMHWMQNQSIAHYPTNIVRQLYQPPWAELAIAHLQILSDTDRFANSVQWFALCGCLIGTSLVAKELGASARKQVYTAVIVATIPMGILQASSTQNDFVLSFWLVCLLYFGMRSVRSLSVPNTAAVGASLGLTMLTKGTGYVFALPLLVWFAAAGLPTHRWKLLPHVLAIGCVAAAANVGHCTRNYALWHQPFGPETRLYANESLSPATLAVNICRNIYLHTQTPSGWINFRLWQMITKPAHACDVDLADPKTTHEGTLFEPSPGVSRHEDGAGNTLHTALIFWTLFVLPWRWVRSAAVRRHAEPHAQPSDDHPSNPFILPCMAALVAAFVLFCLYLKWQPWASRLHLPLFVMWSPLVALAVSSASRIWPTNALMFALIAGAVPFLLTNDTRPIVGEQSTLTTSRQDQYFANRAKLKASFMRAVSDMKRSGEHDDIGLILGGNDWEYPLWILMRDSGKGSFRIEHVEVSNESRSIPMAPFQPTCVFSLRPPKTN